MSNSVPDQFPSWTPGEPNKLEFKDLPSKPIDDDDVDVKVLYCGMCASDVTLLGGELGPILPGAVYGHEIVGEVVRVGPQSEGVKVGDIVGIGAQCDCCRTCEFCEAKEDHFCPKISYSATVDFARWKRGKADGDICRGGFAKYWRGPSRFAIKLPDGLDPAVAAPLLCAGITVFSPLLYYGAGTRAKKVGVVGIGGLGHLAVQLAKAMGAEVTAISRGDSKKEDAIKLGATKYISTSKDLAADFKGHERTLDLIISTINPSELPVNDYLPLLRPRGMFVTLGIIEKPLNISTVPLMMGSVGVAASAIGSPDEIRQMFDLALKHNVRPWIKKYNMDDINTALDDFRAGKPRYRFVMVNTDNGGKM